MFVDSGVTFADFFPGKNKEITYKYETTPGKIVLKADTGSLEIEKTLQNFPDKYSMKYNLNIKNSSKTISKLSGITIYLGKISSPFGRTGNENEIFPELLVENQGNVQKISMARKADEKVVGSTVVVRTRLQMYYFSFQQPVEFFAENSSGYLSWGFTLPEKELKSGEISNFPVNAYIGPADYFVANNEIKEPWVFGTGFFAATGRFLFKSLQTIHRVIPNWGWAIILLTLIIKIVFFPLTREQSSLHEKVTGTQALHERHPDKIQEQPADDAERADEYI